MGKFREWTITVMDEENKLQKVKVMPTEAFTEAVELIDELEEFCKLFLEDNDELLAKIKVFKEKGE